MNKNNFWDLERQDLLLLLYCLLIPFFVWTLFLGISWKDQLIADSDIGNYYLYYQELLKVQGDFTQTLFRPQLMGGVAIHPVMGTPFWAMVCAFLGLSPLFFLNSLVLLIQLCWAFFSIKSIFSLVEWMGQKQHTFKWWEICSLAFMLSFAPFMAWRIAYGHLYLFLGLFPMLTTISVLLSSLINKLSLTHLFMAIFILCSSYPTHGQQLILYSCTLGLPLLIGFWWMGQFRLQILLPLFFIHIVALLWVSPELYFMVQYFFSGDAARSVNSELIYSYSTANIVDWITSFLTLKVELFSTGRESFLLHETNYPIGATLLLLLLLPTKLQKIWFPLLGFSLALFFIFSMNIQPFSNYLLTLLPFLKGFRVPARIALLFNLVLPLLTLSALLIKIKIKEASSLKNPLHIIFLLLLSLFLLFSPLPIINEVILWGIIFAILIMHYKGHPIPSYIILLLAVIPFPYFKERLLPFPELKTTMNLMRSIKYQATQKYPDMANPLIRTNLYFQNNQGINFSFNKGLLVEWSTLEGYHPPPKRFLNMLSALNGKALQEGTMSLNFPPRSSLWKSLALLYNTQYLVNGETGKLEISSLPFSSFGMGWFSQTIIPISTQEEWTSHLRNLSLDKSFILPDDQNRYPIQTIKGECSQSQLLTLNYPHPYQEIKLKLQNSGDNCLLTLPLNYFSFWKAYSNNKGETKPHTTIPSYGVLLGVQIPQDAVEIILTVDRKWPWPLYMAKLLAIILLIVAIIIFQIDKRAAFFHNRR